MNYMNEKWKESYSSMEKEAPLEEHILFPLEEKVHVVKTIAPVIKKRFSLKRKDVKLLLSIREAFRKRALHVEQVRRARTIKEVDQSEFVLDTTSLLSYIVRVLSKTDAAIHINDIIIGSCALGWSTQSKHHKYNIFYNCLRDNYYMFLKEGKGSFRLREAFRGQKPDKVEIKKFIPSYHKKIITLKDIVIDICQSLDAKKERFNPSRVHYIMMRRGYRCAYGSVARIMKNMK